MSSSYVIYYAKNLFDLHTSARLRKKWILYNCRRFSHFFSETQTGNISSTEIWVVRLNMYIWQHFQAQISETCLCTFSKSFESVNTSGNDFLLAHIFFTHCVFVKAIKCWAFFFIHIRFRIMKCQCKVQKVQRRFEWNSAFFFSFFLFHNGYNCKRRIICLIDIMRKSGLNSSMMQCWNCVDTT